MCRWMKDRVQVYDGQRGAWVKYNAKTGAVMQVKKGGEPFRRVQAVNFQAWKEGRKE